MDTKQTQINTFDAGLNTDLHPLTTPNNTLTDCINGTILTHNGNEYILQNDMGNIKIDGGNLKPGYIPIGMKSYNGILYIVSYNPIEKRSEFGSIPSLNFKKSIKKNEINVDIPSFDQDIKYSDFKSINIDFGEVSYDEKIQIINEDSLNIKRLNKYLISSFYILDSNNNATNINLPIFTEYKAANNIKMPTSGKLYGEFKLPYIDTLDFKVYCPDEFGSDVSTLIIIKGKFNEWNGLETNIELDLQYYFDYTDYQYTIEYTTVILNVDKSGFISGTKYISPFNNPKTMGHYKIKPITIKLLADNNYIKYDTADFIDDTTISYTTVLTNKPSEGDVRYTVNNNSITFNFDTNSICMIGPYWDCYSRWYLDVTLFGGNAKFNSNGHLVLNKIGETSVDGKVSELFDSNWWTKVTVPLNIGQYKNSILILSWNGKHERWAQLLDYWKNWIHSRVTDNILIFVGENFKSTRNMYNLKLEDIGNYIYKYYKFSKSYKLQIDNDYRWEYFDNTSNWNKLTLKNFPNDNCVKGSKWFWPAYGTTTTIKADLILDDIDNLKTDFYNILGDNSLILDSSVNVSYNNYSASSFNIKNNQKFLLPLYNIKTIPLSYLKTKSPLYSRSYLINKYKIEENDPKYNSYIFEFINNKLTYSKYIDGLQKVLFNNNILWYGNWDSTEVSLYKDNLENDCVYLGNHTDITENILSTYINHDGVPFIQYLLSINSLSSSEEIFTNFENFTWNNIQSDPIIFLVKSNKDLVLDTSIIDGSDNDYNLFISVSGVDSLNHKYNILSSYIMKSSDEEIVIYNIGKYDNIDLGINIGYNILNLILEHTYKTGDLVSKDTLYLYSAFKDDTLISPNDTKLTINSTITLGALKIFGININDLLNCRFSLNGRVIEFDWTNLLGLYELSKISSDINVKNVILNQINDFNKNVIDDFNEIVEISKTYIDNIDSNKLYNDFSEITLLSVNNRQYKITNDSLKLLLEINNKNKELIDNLSTTDIQYKVESIENLVSSKIGDMKLLRLNNTISYVIPNFTIDTESGETYNIIINSNMHLLSDKLSLSSDNLKDIIYGN